MSAPCLSLSTSYAYGLLACGVQQFSAECWRYTDGVSRGLAIATIVCRPRAFQNCRLNWRAKTCLNWRAKTYMRMRRIFSNFLIIIECTVISNKPSREHTYQNSPKRDLTTKNLSSGLSRDQDKNIIFYFKHTALTIINSPYKGHAGTNPRISTPPISKWTILG